MNYMNNSEFEGLWKVDLIEMIENQSEHMKELELQHSKSLNKWIDRCKSAEGRLQELEFSIRGTSRLKELDKSMDELFVNDMGDIYE